jgi:Icc protein
MKYFTIAQITDLHVGRKIRFPSGEVDLFHQLIKTVDHLNNFNPSIDMVMVSGDLVNHGHLDDYNRVKKELDRLNCPYFIVVGNHDQRETLRKVFFDHSYLSEEENFIQYSIEDKPLRMIVLDTLEPGTHFGLLDEKRLQWLDRKLSEQPDRPTFIIMHHPPFETGMPYPDSLGMRGKKEFGEIISRHKQIEAITSGHTHRDYVIGWNPNVGLVSHLNYVGRFEVGITEGVPKPPENM